MTVNVDIEFIGDHVTVNVDIFPDIEFIGDCVTVNVDIEFIGDHVTVNVDIFLFPNDKKKKT